MKLWARVVPRATAVYTYSTTSSATVRAGRVPAPAPARPAAVTAPTTPVTAPATVRAPACVPRPVRIRGAGHHPGGEELRGDRGEGNLVADITLDLRERHGVLLAGEADGIALGAGAGGATDAVHVVGRVLRQVEVEHVTDIRDVQAAGGHVGRDQDCEFAVVEIAQEAQALVPRHIDGECLGGGTVGLEGARAPLGGALGVHEYQGADRLGLVQQPDEQRHLLLHGGVVHELAHLIDGHLRSEEHTSELQSLTNL